MAPRMFEDKATETVFSKESSLEKANPEKKIGTVSMAGVKIFRLVEDKFP